GSADVVLPRAHPGPVAGARAHLEEARAAAGPARPQPAALPHLRRALAAYGGDFLAGATAGDWATTRRAGLRRAYERALAAAGRPLVADSPGREAVEGYQRAILHEPPGEAAHPAPIGCRAAPGPPRPRAH